MKILVTGSSGHLGEALMRVLPAQGFEPLGLDIIDGPQTDIVGSVCDRQTIRKVLVGVDAIVHCATLYKPHVATHTKQDFIDTNITGTLVLLEEAARAGIKNFVFTSTTSAFGAALVPGVNDPAAWIVEGQRGLPKNIYGATKTAAEDLCALFARKHQMRCTVLRISRFFPEVDDNKTMRSVFADENIKANEFLFRRVDLEDAAHAHISALRHKPAGGFATYIISATTPFQPEHQKALRREPQRLINELFPDFADIYQAHGYRMFDDISRVYVNDLARSRLNWQPKYDFAKILSQLQKGAAIGSDLSRSVGIKGYHSEEFSDGPYPVD